MMLRRQLTAVLRLRIQPQHQLLRLLSPPFAPRFKRYQAFDADLDQDALAEARAWFRSESELSRLPKGNTTYARSSGPGGQHVNKTETKATTAYPVKELLSTLPKLLHRSIRESKYYTAKSDSLTFHTQDSRSRDANAKENWRKLLKEIFCIYDQVVPNETSEAKLQKHEDSRKNWDTQRLKMKKQLSQKKKDRRGPPT
ncbi:RF-PROK-I domain-containing protein [Fusarium falciforme]|uniref:RF-PROK-I domain-containing protein n=1 Tax=Fusarium falciforme TaxID=195108 RepID=UPI0023009E63|nr:RF-PROK-I domain-containing protein [Fusarium falciforme]WAO83987.1 RF-PROK-I domain-containing protein [Fusarium falciforme]